MSKIITDAALTVRHVDGGRRNFARLTVEMPVGELAKFLVIKGIASEVPAHVMDHILGAGDTGSPS